MKSNHSKIILIISVLTILAVIVLNVIFTNMLLNKIVAINDKIKQIDFSSQERENALAVKESVLSSVKERAELATYFVWSGNIETVKFTKFLEDLALEKGVTQRKTLDYETIETLNSSENVSAIRYKFIISGKWSNVYNFLMAIENLPKVARLNNASLSYSEGNKSWSADLDFSVIKLKK